MITARERRLALRRVRSRRFLRGIGSPTSREAADEPKAAHAAPEAVSAPSERQALKPHLSPLRRAMMETLSAKPAPPAQ